MRGIDIIFQLGRSPFPAAMRATLARAVNGKVSGLRTNQSQTARAKPQEWLNQELFFPKVLWDIICDLDVHHSTILAEVARLFERAGIMNGTVSAMCNAPLPCKDMKRESEPMGRSNKRKQRMHPRSEAHGAVATWWPKMHFEA